MFMKVKTKMVMSYSKASFPEDRSVAPPLRKFSVAVSCSNTSNGLVWI